MATEKGLQVTFLGCCQCSINLTGGYTTLTLKLILKLCIYILYTLLYIYISQVKKTKLRDGKIKMNTKNYLLITLIPMISTSSLRFGFVENKIVKPIPTDCI